ncbi:MAG TPA: lipoate--protein ligase family protein [Verrucomicrobiae bacterium]|jgi:lipoate-protein ligase A
MKHFDFTFPTPAKNLACDEALLDWREENSGTGFQPVHSKGRQAGGAVPLFGGEEILRFWESPETFVVVGYANKIAAEVNVENCRAKKIPIFRRCSGGGTVLQGAGCLNYALILRIAEKSPLANISTANQFIMERNRAAVQSLHPCFQIDGPVFNISVISISGHTDLTIGDLKFSGNSQRRRKNFLLFHGTFLLEFNLALVGKFLQMPSKQPDYRNRRGHGEFLMNLNLSTDEVKAAMQKIWKANAPLENPPLEKIFKLAREKYSSREWNGKF